MGEALLGCAGHGRLGHRREDGLAGVGCHGSNHPQAREPQGEENEGPAQRRSSITKPGYRQSVDRIAQQDRCGDAGGLPREDQDQGEPDPPAQARCTAAEYQPPEVGHRGPEVETNARRRSLAPHPAAMLKRHRRWPQGRI